VTPVAAKQAERGPERVPEKIVPPPPYQIEIFNGAARSEAKFARPPEAKQ